MDINFQFCTHEQASKLKALGVHQLSAFAFSPAQGNKLVCPITGVIDMPQEWTMNHAAFSSAELSVMLPTNFSWKKDEQDVELYVGAVVGSVQLYGEEGETFTEFPEFHVKGSEAQGRANCLIYLLENNMIPVEEVNSRLIAAFNQSATPFNPLAHEQAK